MGRLVEARRMIERGLAEFDMCSEAESLATRAAGRDVGVAEMAVLGWILWALGYPDMARARVGAALQRAEAIRDPHSQAYAAYFASVLHAVCQEPAVAHMLAARCLALSEEHGFGHWRNLRARFAASVRTSSTRHRIRWQPWAASWLRSSAASISSP
jgi:hypothetical protein